MRITRTRILTIVAAITGLAVMQFPGLPGNRMPVDEPQTKSEAPLPPGRAQPISDTDPATVREPEQVKASAAAGAGAVGASMTIMESFDRARDRVPELALIAELENQPVDNAAAELIPMLDHGNGLVRRTAVESLGDMSTEAAGRALTTALSDPDPRVRIIALEGLAVHEPWLAVGSIEPYLHDRETTVRLAAIEALSDLDSETAVHALAGLLYDQNTTIRRYAVSALGDIGGGDAMMYLGHARHDPDASVRASADYALSELSYVARE